MRLTLIIACVAYVSAFTLQNVSFPSANVPSGQITLNGNIVWPEGSGPFPGVVLISGSGPQDRWEDNYNVYRPFYDVAVSLADAGVAVIVYDKRTCTHNSSPLCQTVLCSNLVQKNCLIFPSLTINDFQSDAQTALTYLASQSKIDKTRLGTVGHSEGCGYAPQVATEMGASQVVLLMGGGVSWADVMTFQAERQIPVMQGVLQYWESQPFSSEREAMITDTEGQIAALNCTIHTANAQMDLLLNGTLQLGDNAIVCEFGYYSEGQYSIPQGLLCPAQCGTGICAAGKNTNECLDQCNLGWDVSACTALPFAASQLNYFSAATQIAALSAVQGRILAVNSWADLLVPPEVFLPLHEMLETQLTGTDQWVNGTMGTVTEVSTHIFANLTHLLVPYLTAQTVVPSYVTDVITDFIVEGFASGSDNDEPVTKPLHPAHFHRKFPAPSPSAVHADDDVSLRPFEF